MLLAMPKVLEFMGVVFWIKASGEHAADRRWMRNHRQRPENKQFKEMRATIDRRAREVMEASDEVASNIRSCHHLKTVDGNLPIATVYAKVEEELLGLLPFSLTGDQARVVNELRSDLARRRPMRRLLQGDVGTGKTAVAFYACVAAARGGGQAVLAAPN